MARGRQIGVEIVGDSRSLERAFDRSSKAAKGFATDVDRSAKRMSDFRRGALTGFGGAFVANEVINGLRNIVNVAAESEQILGQTRVALQSTGLSWDRYGAKIESAIQAQSRLGFDDEALLQSFSLFVRQSDSVSEALRRNQIAMDISRARFISFEAAAALVNKAALGQAGALRRVGIDARTGASGVQLLIDLEREFGGAAEAASTDAATAMDRLKVSSENAQEALGTLALPIVSNLASVLTTAATQAERLTKALGGLERKSDRLSLGDLFAPITDLPDIIRKSFTPPWKWDELAEKTGLTPGAKAAGIVEDIRGFRKKIEEATKEGKGPSATLRNRWFDALLGRQLDRVQDIAGLQNQIVRLREIARLVDQRIRATKDITRRLRLEDDLLGIQREISSRQTELRENAAAAAKERRAAAAEAERARVETKFGWLEFAVERAEATKTVRDDVKAWRALEAALLERIRQEGRTLELSRDLWRARQRIRDLNKKSGDVDPLAGLTQVSSRGLAAILAAGTGLGVAGRRRLGANIAAQEIQVHVNIDGREVGSAATKQQARTGKRTSRQTSGRRG